MCPKFDEATHIIRIRQHPFVRRASNECTAHTYMYRVMNSNEYAWSSRRFRGGLCVCACVCWSADRCRSRSRSNCNECVLISSQRCRRQVPCKRRLFAMAMNAFGERIHISYCDAFEREITGSMTVGKCAGANRNPCAGQRSQSTFGPFGNSFKRAGRNRVIAATHRSHLAGIFRSILQHSPVDA